MNSQTQPIPRRPLGRTGEELSILGFGGILVTDESPDSAAKYVDEAVEQGVNYFDVAPSYGNAQELLGPALKPHRDRCFLACKTLAREREASREELENSLSLLETDHIDLYQFHAISSRDDVERIFAPGGAMETFAEAREAGKIRFIGFSAHDVAAAHAMLDQFDFDTILFPFNFAAWMRNGFGPSVHERCRKLNMGLLALKALAHERWPDGMAQAERPWPKCWYRPIDDAERAEMALRFTLHLPVTAAVMPGHWPLFKMALDLLKTGRLDSPLNQAELARLEQLADESRPIFEHAPAP